MTIAVCDETGIVLVEKSKKGGSNNIAELWAVAEAMLFGRSCKITSVHINTDSKNTLAWLTGKLGKKLNDRVAVHNLLTVIRNVSSTIPLTTTWVAREHNLAGIYIEQRSAFDTL